VDPLGIEVGVGQQRDDPGAANRLAQRPAELHKVGARTPTRHCGQDYVAEAVDHQDHLGVLGVSDVLVAVSAMRATLDIVSAGVPRLQARAVHGRQRNTSLADPVAQRLLEHSVEHLSAWDGGQQPNRGLLEGGEVGHGYHADLTGKVFVVAEVSGQTAVIEAQELLEHQAGQQLVLSKLLGTELVSVRGESLTGSIVCDLQDPARGFARRHTLQYVARSCQVRWFSTEQ
jgi:hypothetical protein